MQDINEIVALLPEQQTCSNPELTTEQVVKALRIRLLQIVDITFDNFQADANIKTADFLAKLIPIAIREVSTTASGTATTENTNNDVADFLESTYMDDEEAVDNDRP